MRLLRALRTNFDESTSHFMVNYVDDIWIYSKTYEDHLEHLGIALSKLTEAAVTKCKFGQSEVRLLGHIINEHGVAPHPGRITAALQYPTAKNHKQLRRFLGICNYHHRFIVNYSSYVAPLLPLLRKRARWKWDEHKQTSFEALRQRFANSIQLMHPSEDDQFAIYTNAGRIRVTEDEVEMVIKRSIRVRENTRPRLDFIRSAISSNVFVV